MKRECVYIIYSYSTQMCNYIIVDYKEIILSAACNATHISALAIAGSDDANYARNDRQ